MIERLKNKFGVNQPIFTNEIIKEMNNYSRPRVFQLLKKAEQENKIAKYDKGVYYIPTKTRYGISTISVEQVVEKKYLRDKNNIFGIYAGLQMKQNFLLTYQVPTAIEVITNNESMWLRETMVRNRRVIIRKSRLPITKENVDTYIILELFTNINLKDYKEDESVRREIIQYIKEKSLKLKDIIAISSVFPSKTIKNIMESGIINEFA